MCQVHCSGLIVETSGCRPTTDVVPVELVASVGLTPSCRIKNSSGGLSKNLHTQYITMGWSCSIAKDYLRSRLLFGVARRLCKVNWLLDARVKVLHDRRIWWSVNSHERMILSSWRFFPPLQKINVPPPRPKKAVFSCWDPSAGFGGGDGVSNTPSCSPFQPSKWQTRYRHTLERLL